MDHQRDDGQPASSSSSDNNITEESLTNHRRRGGGGGGGRQRNNRQQQRARGTDKLQEIHSALVAPQDTPSSYNNQRTATNNTASAQNNEETTNTTNTTTEHTSDEDKKTEEENSGDDDKSMVVVPMTTDLLTVESDAFAERMLLQQQQQLQQKPNDRDCNDNNNNGNREELFQIEVVPNQTKPNQYADIQIQIKQQQQQQQTSNDGLIAILLIALHVKGWNVEKIHMNNNNTMMISRTYEEEEKEEEEESEQGRARGGGGEEEVVIVVSNNNVPLEEDVLIDLRLLLLSTCADFVCNRRSTLRLLRTFETIIEPRNNLPPARRWVSGHTTAEEEAASLPQNPTSHSIPLNETTQGVTKHTNNVPADEALGARPGAFATPGRAFGAPVRRRPSYGIDNNNNTPPSRPPGGGSMSRFLSSTSQYISTRFLGSRERRAAGPTESCNVIEEGNSSSNNDNYLIPLAAEVVESQKCLEDRVRTDLLRESAEATLVTDTEENPGRAKLQRNMLALLAIALLTALIVFLVTRPEKVTPTEGPTGSPTMDLIPTIQAILERDSLRCCSQEDSTSPLRLLEIELCRGLAASVLGDDTKYEVTCQDYNENHWESLHSGESDVIIRSASTTMGRTIQEPTTGRGFSFSSPYFYDGLAFGGDFSNAPCVDCADRLDTFFGSCRDLVVCIRNGTTHSDFLAHRMPPRNVRLVESFENVLKDGICNVIGTDAYQRPQRIDDARNSTHRKFAIGSNRRFSFGSMVFTKEPLAIVTRSEDYIWTSFVEVFLQGLLEAEERNITKATPWSFPSVPYFGKEFEDMIIRAVASIGNFGEVYKRTFASNRLPRTGLNELRTDGCQSQGGLIYGFPFGHHIEESPRTVENGRLASVLERESLKCGVSADEATSGFNTKVCMAIASALFGEKSMNQFETFTFDLISEVRGEDPIDVDVFIGASSTSLHYLRDSFQNFTFSKPYLFSPNGGEELEARVLVTESGDHKWSAFVQWVINSVINAEELSLSKEERDLLLRSKVDFDIVPLVGPDYAPVFQDILSSVGNYQEIFNSTMNVTRSGCNLENENAPPYGPQHFPFLFQGL